MKSTKFLNVAWLLAVPALCSAATIYECRAYNGSSFYYSNRCSQHNALGC